MKQKTALAGALIHDPKLLMLDEPLTGLDAAVARQVKDLLQQRARSGGTVILTTHILDVAERARRPHRHHPARQAARRRHARRIARQGRRRRARRWRTSTSSSSARRKPERPDVRPRRRSLPAQPRNAADLAQLPRHRQRPPRSPAHLLLDHARRCSVSAAIGSRASSPSFTPHADADDARRRRRRVRDPLLAHAVASADADHRVALSARRSRSAAGFAPAALARR